MMPPCKVTIEMDASGRPTRVLVDGVPVPYVRRVRAEETMHEAPTVTLELVARAEWVRDGDPPPASTVEAALRGLLPFMTVQSGPGLYQCRACDAFEGAGRPMAHADDCEVAAALGALGEDAR